MIPIPLSAATNSNTSGAARKARIPVSDASECSWMLVSNSSMAATSCSGAGPGNRETSRAARRALMRNPVKRLPACGPLLRARIKPSRRSPLNHRSRSSSSAAIRCRAPFGARHLRTTTEGIWPPATRYRSSSNGPKQAPLHFPCGVRSGRYDSLSSVEHSDPLISSDNAERTTVPRPLAENRPVLGHRLGHFQ